MGEKKVPYISIFFQNLQGGDKEEPTWLIDSSAPYI